MSERLAADLWPAIAAGGALGASIRWAIAHAAARLRARRPRGFDPGLATLAANLTACLLLGWLLTPSELAPAPGDGGSASLAGFATAGVCGSLSTFSTLCADATRQLQTGRLRGAVLYLVAHIAGGPAVFWAGALLAR